MDGNKAAESKTADSHGTVAAPAVQGRSSHLAKWQLFIALFLVVALWRLFGSSPPPETILSIRGNHQVSSQEIQQAAGIRDGGWAVLLRPETLRQNVLRDVRLRAAEVRWAFPLTLVVRVEERVPVALIAGRFGFVEVDDSGMVLSTYKNLNKPAVPLITGVQAGSEYVGDRIAGEQLATALDFIARLDAATVAQLSELNLQRSDRIIAISRQSFQIRLGSLETLGEKTAALDLILKDVLHNKAPIDYIDISYAIPTVKFKH